MHVHVYTDWFLKLFQVFIYSAVKKEKEIKIKKKTMYEISTLSIFFPFSCSLSFQYFGLVPLISQTFNTGNADTTTYSILNIELIVLSRT